MTVLSLKDPIQYFQLAESPSEEVLGEWEHMLAYFMNGETSFCWDSGQLCFLKTIFFLR